MGDCFTYIELLWDRGILYAFPLRILYHLTDHGEMKLIDFFKEIGITVCHSTA